MYKVKQNSNWLLSILLLVCNLLQAQSPIQVSDKLTSININQNTQVYSDENTSIRDINAVLNANESQFKPNTMLQYTNFGYHNPRAWCKFRIKKNISETIILRVEQSRTDTLQVFIKYGNDSIIKFNPIGRFTSLYTRYIPDRNYIFPIDSKAGEILDIYVYSTRMYGHHALDMQIYSLREFKNYSERFSILFGIICGISLVVTIISFLVYFVYKQKLHLWYGLYCLNSLFLTFSDTGYFNAYFQSTSFHNQFNSINSIAFFLLVISRIHFTNHLFEFKDRAEGTFLKIGRYSTLFLSFMVLCLLFQTPQFWLWSIIYVGYFIVFYVDIYVLFAVILGLKKPTFLGYFYTIGFTISLVSFTILILGNLEVIDLYEVKDAFYSIPVFEILLILVGITIQFMRTNNEEIALQRKYAETQKQILTIQENERERIARDLHDEVGNSLAALKNQIQSYGNHEQLSTIQKIVHSLRSITHDLIPPNLESQSLWSRVEDLLNAHKQNPQIEFEFMLNGTPRNLDILKDLALYRAVTELLTNIIKHSKARNVLLQMTYSETDLILNLEDDGIPFDFSKHFYKNPDKAGIGIRNLWHRFEFLNAKVNSQSDQNGNIVMIIIPFYTE
ncbi:MAG: sensor histidine kinase [Leadbetterella sp.]